MNIDLDNYKFKDLMLDISTGKEIEFNFKNLNIPLQIT